MSPAPLKVSEDIEKQVIEEQIKDLSSRRAGDYPKHYRVW